MKKNLMLLLLLSSLVVLFGFTHLGHREVEKKMTLIALSDLHGSITPDYFKTKNGEKVPFGGAEYLASYIHIIRQKSLHPSILLDGGDLFQGTIISNHFEGKPVIKFYNHIGVDAVALGNHEFDYGPIGPNHIPMSEGDDPRGVLKERIGEAHFPFLAANVFEKNHQRPSWIRPSLMIERGGLKIGVVGAATEETPNTTEKKNLVGLTFERPLQWVVKEGEELRKAGADFVILLIHAGAVCDNQKSGINDISGCKGELIDLAKAVPEGLFNAIVGGHTHHSMMKKFRKMALVQSYPKGKSLVWVELSSNGSSYINTANRICGLVVPTTNGKTSCSSFDVERSQEKPIRPTFLGQEIDKDQEVLNILKEEIAISEKIRNRKLGVGILTPFERSYYDESALGNFTADFLLKHYEGTAVGSFTNNGGVRANIPVGDLTYGNMYDALPFDNQAALIRVKGKTVKKIIELGINRKHSGMSWGGVTFHATKCHVDWVRIDNKEILDENDYLLITNDYIAGGGGGMSSIQYGPSEGLVPMNGDSAPIREKIVTELEKSGGAYSSTDFYSPHSPRQIINGICE